MRREDVVELWRKQSALPRHEARAECRSSGHPRRFMSAFVFLIACRQGAKAGATAAARGATAGATAGATTAASETPRPMRPFLARSTKAPSL